MRRNSVKLWVTVVLVLGTFVATIFSDNRPQLGLDLQGGITVVLFPVKGSDLSTLGTAVEIISNRVNALGVSEPEVNRQGDTIVINLPGAKNRQEALDLVGRTAVLRFRPVVGFIPAAGLPVATSTTEAPSGSSTSTAPGQVATTVSGQPGTTAGPASTAAGATSTTAGGPVATTVPSGSIPGPPVTGAPREAGRARSISTSNIAVNAPVTTTPTGVTTTAAPGVTTTAAPGSSTTTAAGDTPTTVAARAACKDRVTPRSKDLENRQVILATKPGEAPESAGCYQLDPAVLTGKSVSGAKARYSSTDGGWVVDVSFKGSEFVDKVAVPYVNQRIAIALDGVVYSAPTIQPGITGSKVQITGSFTEGEAKDLALVLRYGALPVQFDKKQETVQSVSPTLGKDQLWAGIVAGVVGLLLVALYMALFYRVLGIVVWLGLGLTALLFFTLVSFLSAQVGLSMTLAGITGLIVSVGVTVDSYVVYFERLKDEVRMGKTVRSSVDGGFTRAFRTIVAADLVSLMSAAVLYVLATGSVRGFAFFLGISTAIDLLIAYFFMHPLVSMMARKPGLVRLRRVGIAAGLDVPQASA